MYCYKYHYDVCACVLTRLNSTENVMFILSRFDYNNMEGIQLCVSVKLLLKVYLLRLISRC